MLKDIHVLFAIIIPKSRQGIVRQGVLDLRHTASWPYTATDVFAGYFFLVSSSSPFSHPVMVRGQNAE
jgi:hypothetical protein